MSEGGKCYGEEYNMKDGKISLFVHSYNLLISQSKKICFGRPESALPDSTSDSSEQPPSVANDRESYCICC